MSMPVDHTLAELAQIAGGVVEGDGALRITGLAGIREAEPGELSYIDDPRRVDLLGRCRASALIVKRDLALEGFHLIRVEDPAEAWWRLVDLLGPAPSRPPEGIHPRAAVHPGARLGRGVAVGALAVVEEGARVGDGAVIHPAAFVGRSARVGAECILHAHAVIKDRVVLGDRVEVHGGAVVGSSGFGYAAEDGLYRNMERCGTVVVEDDVEIGAGVTIDRARFGETRIGRGTRIDNLVQIAHDVVIGEGCIIMGQAGIAAGVRLGRHVVLSGQVGVAEYVHLGDYVRVSAKAGVTKHARANEMLYGNPAGSYTEKKREVVSMRKIPEILESLKALSERVRRLETQPENHQEPR